VPNHLVEQWAADVYRLYPGAKVLAAGKNQFDKQNRRRCSPRIATGDWDMVIVPHSSFGFIGISPETELRFLDEELRIAMEAVKEAGKRRPRRAGQGRLAQAAHREGGRAPGHQHPGPDGQYQGRSATAAHVRADGRRRPHRRRGHEFKNLFYSSRLTDVRGMGDKSGSQKAFDLYNKVKVLRESPTGTVTFMTGTPISNSAVEMYTMMRYLAAKELEGSRHRALRRLALAVRLDAAAEVGADRVRRLKEVTRLGRSWSNMRSLMELYYSFTDAVTQEDINAGTPRTTTAPASRSRRSRAAAQDGGGQPTPAQIRR
jgi:N12 class adenine-specific DNA methylase